MHFLTLASAFVAILPSKFALAVDTNPYNTSAGALATTYPGGLDFYSNCWTVKGCVWEQALDDKNKPIPNAKQCSCNKNPDKWSDLIWWYTKKNFTGDLYKGFGHYGECQDLPTHWQSPYSFAESVQIALAPPQICTLYTQIGCDGKAGASIPRDSTKASENSMRELTGWYYNGTRSWKCVLKK